MNFTFLTQTLENAIERAMLVFIFKYNKKRSRTTEYTFLKSSP
ncbi:hypothetical protein T4D_2474 [Trichinella pseudospiralis]|uniref:Uncharacterized protein n=1 Tax=Trichinella pseudospiralis TaxID=6337 RepID=A0A0V1DMV0_TRIPS|nr:hypothetical protein T4D_2474 [Trichinella pseudospiralis]